MYNESSVFFLCLNASGAKIKLLHPFFLFINIYSEVQEYFIGNVESEIKCNFLVYFKYICS